MSEEMSEEQVRENLQVVSITVNWGVADILRMRPDWSVEKAEHFIDSVYQELSAEAREAGDAFLQRVIAIVEEEERGQEN